ncbi:hypothetical protein BIY22_00830 [Vibrio panuliri]|uniref:Apea-like HEPN domain-containing protein n=1 Tax=Vibrio panuliri TaxID=1381081 RepID=A0A1Q9HQD1_9VIBR|nr:hypothetical protein [Vibrio panuliri]OLQ93068.1 hypothetical protein BIY22_00830 [Vibrio panuliri]
MRRITQTTWSGLPFKDYRNRFFIEVWREILYVDTPSFYQSKTMNIMSGAEEIIEAIDDYLIDPKNGNLLVTLLQDYKTVVNIDSVAKKVLKGLHSTLKKKINLDKESINDTVVNDLKLFMKVIVSREDIYYNELKKQLKSSILGQVDLTKKDRIMRDIYTLTKMYIGHLLWKGYSPTYLYNRMEYLTRTKNYGKRDFSAQLHSCLDKLTVRVSDYNVYFLVSPLSKYLISSKEILGVEFFEYHDYISDSDYKKLAANFDSIVVAKIVVNTTDYVSAAWKANEILDKVVDFMSIEKPLHNLRYSPICLTEFKLGALSHSQTINIGRLKQFITNKDTDSLELISDSRKVQFRHSISLERYDVLNRSLRYLRIAKESTSLEQKLMGLWIALECIFEMTEGNIISGITSYVPFLYGSQSIEIRIRYAKSLLEARLKKLPSSWVNQVSSGVTKFSELNVEEFFDLMKIEKNRHNVYSDLTKLGEEFVVFRVIHVFDCLETSEKIVERIDSTESDVNNQLIRIYKVRNKLTHRAFYGHVRPQLVDNLLSYLHSSYNALILGSVYDSIEDFDSLDIFNAHKLGYEIMKKDLKISDKKLEELNYHNFVVTEQF